ncbi:MULTISPECIES: limonene-1,2-epoxide hydrolase family protein [Sphingobium]|jgi:limonene-1,2-epoxide hydrolase|uniref:limonene-1,2-epoxide hydrolase family protein n=1 Tax=Sphingobium TaxID=165695 RepID=UPI00211EEBA9|nr:limonene-1,2-epoxide hydrolase family protein [Sphingobium sp. IP1]
MPGPLDEALAFFQESSGSREDMLSAMERRFTAETHWENVGVATTVGIDQARAFVEAFLGRINFERCAVVIHHAAAAGNVVLTERSDIFYGSDGQEMLSLRLMGALEMDGPHIVAWRDYFDTSGF